MGLTSKKSICSHNVRLTMKFFFFTPSGWALQPALLDSKVAQNSKSDVKKFTFVQQRKVCWINLNIRFVVSRQEVLGQGFILRNKEMTTVSQTGFDTNHHKSYNKPVLPQMWPKESGPISHLTFYSGPQKHFTVITTRCFVFPSSRFISCSSPSPNDTSSLNI